MSEIDEASPAIETIQIPARNQNALPPPDDGANRLIAKQELQESKEASQDPFEIARLRFFTPRS